jgi:diguanylate cyclase (GGDEF)-like protein
MQWKYFWLIPAIFWTLVLGASFRWNWQQLDKQAFDMAAGQGRDIFRMIEAMRLWNAQHGGLYVVQSDRTPPNPYLDVPDRDPVTLSGKRLTMVNPAYMTRQMAATIEEQSGIRVHITSLKPINPGNRADDWEALALRRFEGGLREYAEIVEGREPLLRYMAPLVAKAPCISCHEKQGYKVGDIRGGISVSFSAEPILAAMAPHKKAVAFGHLGVWALLVALTTYFLVRIRRHVGDLERARAEQEHLVEVRTGELREEARERLQAEHQLRHLVEATSGGIIGTDALGRCLVCNPMAARMLGLAGTQALRGQSIAPLLEVCSPRLADLLKQGLAGHSAIEEALPIQSGNASIVAEARVDPILEGGQVVGAVLALLDATERQARQREIWHQANFDHLTGLANRSLFLDRLERALLLQGRRGTRLAVLFMDLDGFKPVNDTYGHAAGDAVLIEVAQRLSSTVRSTDIAARFGGDEFVVGLTDIRDIRHVELLARKILAVVRAPYRVGEHRVELSASIGIALFPDDQQGCDALLAAADEAMYRAKQAGKGGGCFHARGHFTPLHETSDDESDDSV